MSNHFFNARLQQAEIRVAASAQNAQYRLDKNEQSDDIEHSMKAKVLARLMKENWNRYPDADHKDIEAGIAEYCGLNSSNIALGPGSASLITTLLNYFALNNKKLFITQPSYSLFDYHCKTYNIPYQPWQLSPELEFDLEQLPGLDASSVLIITSPNNPTGNVIDKYELEYILNVFPDSLIILDSVYSEFSEHDFTPLVKRYPNLIVLRSFSKAFPVAGLRLGYLCAAPELTATIKKLVLQFSITPFTLAFAREILFDAAFMARSRQKVQDIIEARENMRQRLQENFSAGDVQVFNSQGNFLLIRIHSDTAFERVIKQLSREGIKVLNTSACPLLENSFRVSIGNAQENEAFFQCMQNALQREYASSYGVFL